jgi:N-methylhydantoinase A
LKGSRHAYLPEREKFAPCVVYDRYALNGRFAGPAIIEERESTVVVGEGAKGEVDALGNLLVTLPRVAGARGAR